MAEDIVTRLRDYLAIVDHAFVWNELSDAADEIERLRADRDRWRKIALWNLEMAGYDNPEEHVRLCYYEDGTYHGGAR